MPGEHPQHRRRLRLADDGGARGGDEARCHGLRLHLDGARLWNAAVATGIPEHEWAAPFDTISVCFSKGLGAPVGSALAGPRDFIARARRFKALFGGGIRQGGIVAAGALFALENNRSRLSEDHANASRLAQRLASLPGILLDPATVQTNIVRFRLRDIPAGSFVDRCHASGVHMLPTGASGVCTVTHLDVSAAEIEHVAEVIERTLKRQAA